MAMPDVIIKNTYRIHMKRLGRISQLPDSQRIFGALMHYYATYVPPETVKAFVQGVRDKHFFFSLSNLLPEGYLPSPQAYLLDRVGRSDGQAKKPIYKAIKERQYVTRGGLDKLVKAPEIAQNIYPYVKVEASQQIHASIDSLRYDLPGLPPNVFSTPEEVALEVTGEQKSQRSAVTEFVFYLSVDGREETVSAVKPLLDALRTAAQEQTRFFLGQRASQGMNTYEIVRIEERPEQGSGGPGNYLNLGMLLPDDIGYDKSALSLHTSQRRPYDPVDGWNASKEQFISYVAAGSVIHLEKGVERAGKCIDSMVEPGTVTFGNAYLYPIDLGGDAVE